MQFLLFRFRLLDMPVPLGCVALSVLPFPWLNLWVQQLILSLVPRIDFSPSCSLSSAATNVHQYPAVLRPHPQINAFVLLGEISHPSYRALLSLRCLMVPFDLFGERLIGFMEKEPTTVVEEVIKRM